MSIEKKFLEKILNEQGTKGFTITCNRCGSQINTNNYTGRPITCSTLQMGKKCQGVISCGNCRKEMFRFG